MKTTALCCACLLVVAGRAAASDVLYVPGDYPTIQAAIEAAIDLDVVEVAPDLYPEQIDFLGKAITVRSSGGADVTTIDGEGSGPVVSFLSGEGRGSVLEGFTIVGGDAGFGGGIVCITASPTIRDCVIATNSALHGGGLYAAEGGLLVERCAFDANTASLEGGAIWLGCCPPNNMPSEFLDCAITGNSSALGGGLYSTGGWFEFRSCSFRDNTGGAAGGAVALATSGGNLFEACEFLGNTAISGGAISQADESEATLRDCTFRDNGASAEGGAIMAASTSFPIYAFDCVFERNHANDYGGALAASSAGIDVTRCSFIDNTSARGGAIAVDFFTVGATVTGGSFSGNAATEGGAIYHMVQPLTLSDAVLRANSAGAGGAIYSSYARDDITGCEFAANEGANGGALYGVDGNGPIADCTFADNTATGHGGAVFVNELDGRSFDRCTFERNTESGMYCVFSFPSVHDSTFRDHPDGAVIVVDNEYGFYPTIGDTLFCANGFDIQGPSYDDGGNTFLPWCDCVPDWNTDGAVNTQDVLAYLNDWVAKDPGADVTGDGLVDTRDFLAFLNLWVAGC